MRYILILVGGLLSGCAVQTAPVVTQDPTMANFTQVVGRVEPVAERICRHESQTANCNFEFVVDRRGNQSANAYQSLTDSGRPVLTVTAALIDDMENPDELAFVLGHEASHHILGHLAKQEENAAAGAMIFGGLATLTGGSQADVKSAQQLGAAVGARSYSKEFELEADALGTIISYYAGYDPMLGAAYFARLPDPGNRFLGSHPPNAARVETVKYTLSQLEAHS